MKNVVNRMRDVLFKDLYAAINIYEKIFNFQLLNFKFYRISYDTRLKSENDNVFLIFNYFFVNKTQFIEFNAQFNTALKS